MSMLKPHRIPLCYQANHVKQILVDSRLPEISFRALHGGYAQFASSPGVLLQFRDPGINSLLRSLVCVELVSKGRNEGGKNERKKETKNEKQQETKTERKRP